ncbi:DUF2207 domain-containing protein [Propionicimonas sp.]|uniref:DUF2207 domain-containing protein n=1 Tax=Propionicimonas sp. TaxID=1955623 RepID=UPI0039E4DC72
MSRRAPGRWPAALAALLLTGWILVGVAPTARAASADVFDSFDVAATLDAEGYVHVTETIVLRFGSSSGRHGLERTLITREPDGDDHDVVYQVDQVRATSPTPGVSTKVDTSEQGSGRNTYLRIRVGSSDRTVSTATATYVLSYRVLGLVRTSGTYDELYWDISGSSMPTITMATAKITVPGGALDVFCSVALPGRTGDCTKSVISNEVAQFAASSIPTGEVMTVSVKIAPGLVTHNTPIQVENADAAAQRQTAWAFGGSLAGAALVPFVGWWYLRRRSRDYRWEGVPPGSFPARGQQASEVLSDPRTEIPVCFAPPQLGVAEAGLLIDGETQVRDTTAALVSLAVAGAIQLRSDDTQQVRLVDPSRAPDATSTIILAELFPAGSRPGRVVDLGEPGTLSQAHERVQRTVLARATQEHWFARLPGAAGGLGCGIGGLLFPLLTVGIVGSAFVGAWLLLAFPLLLSVAVTAVVVQRKLRRGQRSAYGRALTDQVEGFRTYLATAEAEQLRFEEGEDIFSRYLPWAIMYDLTERWTQVCQRLVELGRIPDVAPTWYYGTTWNLNSFVWQLNTFDSSVGTSIASPAPTFSESGFGSGGSAFGGGSFGGGGGFSGGGGGGGGGGSW